MSGRGGKLADDCKGAPEPEVGKVSGRDGGQNGHGSGIRGTSALLKALFI